MSSPTFYGHRARSLPITFVPCVTNIWFHCDTVYQTLSTVCSSSPHPHWWRLYTDFIPVSFSLFHLYFNDLVLSTDCTMKPIHPHYILKKSVHFVESLFPILGILYRMHHRSFLSMTPLCSIKIICFVATDPIHLTMTAKVSCLTPLSSLFLIGPAASLSRWLSPATDPFLIHWFYVLYLFFKKVENLQPPSFFFSGFLSSSPSCQLYWLIPSCLQVYIYHLLTPLSMLIICALR